MQIEVQDKEIERKARELQATVERPADAERYRVRTLAEAEQFKLQAEAAGRAEAAKSEGLARAEVDKAGFGEQFIHRTGHSISFDVLGNGANIDNYETRDRRTILPGTCFSIEPGIYFADRRAVRTEIDVMITPAGEVEIVGDVQQELILIRLSKSDFP